MAPEQFIQCIRNAEKTLNAKRNLTFIGRTAAGQLAAVLLDEQYLMYGFLAPSDDPADTRIFDTLADEQIVDFRARASGGSGFTRSLEIWNGEIVDGMEEVDHITVEGRYGYYFLNNEPLLAIVGTSAENIENHS